MAYVAYDSTTNLVKAARRTEAQIDAWIAADGNSYSKSGDVTAPRDITGPDQYTFDSTASTFAPSEMSDSDKTDAFKDDLKQKLYRAYDTFSKDVRRQSWGSLQASGTTRYDALVATDRWVYHQIAIGYRIAEGDAPFSATTDEQKITLVDHIADIIVRLGYTWYKVMRDGTTTLRASWAATSVADGATLYSDIVTTAGATRAPDGSYTTIAGGTIPASFSPEVSSLTEA